MCPGNHPFVNLLNNLSAFIRAFVAIELKPGLIVKLEKFQKSFQDSLGNASVRWTRREQLHLTLKFLGNIEAGCLKDVEVALQRACRNASAFRLRAKGMGCFPNPKESSIIWIGIEGE